MMRVVYLSIALSAFSFTPGTSLAQDSENSDPIRVTLLNSGVEASFRGLAMRGPEEVWVTGNQGTVLRTHNGGRSWQTVVIPGSDFTDADGKKQPADFRDVALLPDGSVLVMSIGPGEASRVYHSADGRAWEVVLQNDKPAGFFDGMDFDAHGKNGLLYGDPIDGRLDIAVTRDAGRTWRRLPESNRPRLIDGEYGFAASGSGAIVRGQSFWVATGGSTSRVHHSADGGRTWSVVNVPLRSGNESSGIFSMASDGKDAFVVVGGDYLMPELGERNVAFSGDAGRTWATSQSLIMPHKACACWLGNVWFLTCGRTGIAYSRDSGRSWTEISQDSWYVCGFDRSRKVGFLAGKDGRIARFTAQLPVTGR